VTASVDGPEFERFLTLMLDHPHFYTKVTCPERLSVTGPPDYDDVRCRFARTLVETFPTGCCGVPTGRTRTSPATCPTTAGLVDFVPRIAVTEELRERLLVDNPTRLYWDQP